MYDFYVASLLVNREVYLPRVALKHSYQCTGNGVVIKVMMVIVTGIDVVMMLMQRVAVVILYER